MNNLHPGRGEQYCNDRRSSCTPSIQRDGGQGQDRRRAKVKTGTGTEKSKPYSVHAIRSESLCRQVTPCLRWLQFALSYFSHKNNQKYLSSASAGLPTAISPLRHAPSIVPDQPSPHPCCLYCRFTFSPPPPPAPSSRQPPAPILLRRIPPPATCVYNRCAAPTLHRIRLMPSPPPQAPPYAASPLSPPSRSHHTPSRHPNLTTTRPPASPAAPPCSPPSPTVCAPVTPSLNPRRRAAARPARAPPHRPPR